ncbi:hypothetical protein GCM10007392_23490 [Saccharospirillum salsuginis]|uniref:General secretion pathway GspH domain-containing protein n=2 Tax=Saccharospirillum salsuginis TaxID=418750 RepID=A0A918KAN1_9GAMM|nr:hypothetical protein GCM10007392_23490 [Saccharospirillum salsuginis]
MADLMLARSESVTQGRSISVCALDSPSAETCTTDSGDTSDWTNGWLVFVDVDEQNDLDSGTDEILSIYTPAADFVSLRNDSKDSIQFNRQGGAPLFNSTFTFCHEKASIYNALVLSSTGRVAYKAGDSSKC